MKYCQQCGSVYPTDFLTCPRDQSALSAADDIAIGMTLRDKYNVVEKIGAGGMATVYKVRRVPFNDIYALKLVNKGLAADPQFVKRFRAEAVMAHQLSHPNIVRIYDLDTTEDGRPLMVMEFVEGSDLRSLVRRSGALPLATALDLAAQVAEGLDCAHRAGIIHRDIKPDNILIADVAADRPIAKIADFGIAKALEATPGATIGTSTGMLIGTPQYTSPEHSMGMKSSELDGRADLYSLAIVLYEMLAGQLPFHSDTAMGYLLQHVQSAPPAPRELNPACNIPEPVTAVLMKGLAKDRNQRFQTGAEFAAALRDPQAWAAQQQKTADSLANAGTVSLSAISSTTLSTVSLPFAPAITPARPLVAANASITGGATPSAAAAKPAPLSLAAPAPTNHGAGFAPVATVPDVAASIPVPPPATSRHSGALVGALAAIVVVLLSAVAFMAWRTLHRPQPPISQSAGLSTPAPSPLAASAPATTVAPDSLTPPIMIPSLPKPSAAIKAGNLNSAGMAVPASKVAPATVPVPAVPKPIAAPAASPNPKVVAELKTADQKLVSGDFGGAVKSYEKTLKMDPANSDAQRGLEKAKQGKSASSFVVDAGTFRRMADAEAMAVALKSKGYDPHISPISPVDRAFHVQLGPMDRKKASKLRQKIEKDGYSTSVVPVS